MNEGPKARPMLLSRLFQVQKEKEKDKTGERKEENILVRDSRLVRKSIL